MEQHICTERVIRVHKITNRECYLTVDITDDIIIGYMASLSKDKGIDEYKLRDFLKEMYEEDEVCFNLREYYAYHCDEIIDYYFNYWFTEEEEWEDANDYYDGWEYA